jgi:hypothetical protein
VLDGSNQKKNLLTRRWDTITAKRDLWGAERFWDVCKLTDFADEFYYKKYQPEEVA